MNHSRITSRYAKSLLLLSIEENILDAVLNDIDIIYSTCIENKEFNLLLRSPIIKTDKKIEIINQIFGSKLHSTTTTFINIITKKKRERYIESICKTFISQYKLYRGIEEVTIKTAVKIDEDTRNQVLSFVSRHGKSNIEMNEVVDESLIGGAVIRFGDKQIDSSVSKTIKQLKQIFNKNLYIQDY